MYYARWRLRSLEAFGGLDGGGVIIEGQLMPEKSIDTVGFGVEEGTGLSKLPGEKFSVV